MSGKEIVLYYACAYVRKGRKEGKAERKGGKAVSVPSFLSPLSPSQRFRSVSVPVPSFRLSAVPSVRVSVSVRSEQGRPKDTTRHDMKRNEATGLRGISSGARGRQGEGRGAIPTSFTHSNWGHYSPFRTLTVPGASPYSPFRSFRVTGAFLSFLPSFPAVFLSFLSDKKGAFIPFERGMGSVPCSFRNVPCVENVEKYFLSNSVIFFHFCKDVYVPVSFLVLKELYVQRVSLWVVRLCRI